MNSTLEQPATATQEQLPYGNEFYLTQVKEVFHDGYVPTMASLEYSQSFVAAMPHDKKGNILNDDKKPVPRELQDEVEESLREGHWRLDDASFNSSKAVANYANETQLSAGQFESYNTFHAAAENDGRPSDFSAFRQYASAWAELESEFRARDEERKTAAEERKTAAAKVARPKPGQIGAVKSSSQLNVTGNTADSVDDNNRRSKPKSRRSKPEDDTSSDVIVPASKERKASVIPADESNAPEVTNRKPYNPEYKVPKQKGKKWQWQTRSAEDLADLFGSRDDAFKKQLLVEELRDLGLEPTAANLAAYAKPAYLAGNGDRSQTRQDRFNVKEFSKDASRELLEISKITGQLALSRLVQVGKSSKGFYERWKHPIYKVTSIGHIALSGIDPSLLLDQEKQYDKQTSIQPILESVRDGEETPKQKRKAAARNEELRQAKAGKRTGRFVVGGDGTTEYNSRQSQ